jgi:hypothetical protein
LGIVKNEKISSQDLIVLSILLAMTAFIASGLFFSMPRASFVEEFMFKWAIGDTLQEFKEYRDIKIWAFVIPIVFMIIIWWNNEITKKSLLVFIVFCIYCLCKPWVDYYIGQMISKGEFGFSWFKYILLLVMVCVDAIFVIGIVNSEKNIE